MYEIRRVFHNVNSDPSKVIPLPPVKKPSVRFYEDTNLENSDEINFQSANEKIFDTPRENGSSSHLENIQNPVQTDFSEPKLLTSLKILESLKNIGNEKKSKKLITSNSKYKNLKVKQKASKKVNIPFEEKVYKGLIELQVTDEDLGLHRNIPLKAREFSKAKEPEPVLSEFYKPKFDKEYVIKPSVPKFQICPILIKKIPSILAKTKSWEPPDI